MIAPRALDARRRRVARWWAARERLGASDCEAIRSGPIAQPVNAVSSAAYVAAGAWVAARAPAGPAGSEARRAAVALAAAGVGSILYHGPCPPGARWAHDASLAALLADVVVHDLAELVDARSGGGARPAAGGRVEVAHTVAARPEVTHAVVSAILGGALAARPQGANAIATAAGAGAIAAEAVLARRGRRPRWRVAAALLAGGAAVNVVSRTGAPACRPHSWWQGHALWHALTAAAFAAWAHDATVRPAAPPVAR
ncbi:MAG TPA: hypothetical protein VK866_11715 [Acidimicrobiales bacterium]|nr:hypothetical protein [Acidimicrobiales bacterium]